ncbi:MAG: ABC transporter ATP-binding protein [Candidatus Puniceispirillum sp.]|uniref:ABC transporter ATP-binding protein n=1 Tax=Candidatus Puniceispirillum sp. TaxID=2026719 RepID=UPI001EC4C4BF|nr:ABC transporter ATP-binding protein [Candidatus Puniceispirillum sp.]MBT6414948.1 ABC transporter ATP-binding protein [Candidatus Puniceispirillum sp.]MBT6566938.1 ABC transporter ATP-binding protein [Candidatus Puniceispirillum sp.]
MLIEAQNLSKAYTSKPAAKNVSFSATAGSIIGLLGSNGAGKSTIMRMLVGSLTPDAGQAFINGYDIVTQRRQAQHQLGYLPESAVGFNNLSVYEFLAFTAEARGFTGHQKRTLINNVFDQLDLGGVRHKLLGTLSKGWRQRSWLGQALLHNPPVLILDEPTDGLDPNQKSQLREKLKILGKTKTILMSTHILEEAENMCARLVVMRDSQLVADGSTSEFVDKNGRLETAIHALTAPTSDDLGKDDARNEIES